MAILGLEKDPSLERGRYSMCTAATYMTKDFYFGRTLDNSFGYEEEVVVTPRRYPFYFRKVNPLLTHHAMIGIAYVCHDFPLYYDAVNEKGLAMAGLNFVDNAVYNDVQWKKDNIAQFEFIPWVLGQCASVRDARKLLASVNLIKTPFCDDLPAAQLHWLIADRDEAITVESVQDGLKVYDNPLGILTNNPAFPEQLFHLNNYMALSCKPPQNLFSSKLELKAYSLGMGAFGLPGDLSSQARFVRAAFTKMNSRSGDSESESVGQFFHILGSVSQPRGCCETEEGDCEITLYTSCCNVDKGIYYYTSYDNHQISAVNMCKVNLDKSFLARYPLIHGEQIRRQN